MYMHTYKKESLTRGRIVHSLVNDADMSNAYARAHAHVRNHPRTQVNTHMQQAACAPGSFLSTTVL